MSNAEIAYLSATELLHHFRRKSLSPVEVARNALERIEAYDGAVNAFCFLDEDTTMARARASEERWMKGEPLGLVDGVPTTIKDLLLSKGWPTLRGSKLVDPNQTWSEDAPVVARLSEHGAVFLGKTTSPEFGWKGVTDSPLNGITRNPWDTSKTPGGSSGGAVVAAALGIGPLHLGTDGGGSIRIPAAFTGVVGLKPSFGRVPVYPASAFGTLSHAGPLTRTVDDAALMLTVLAKPDPRDWFALPYDHSDYRTALEEGIRGLRIAFSPNLGHVSVAAEVASCVGAAAKVFEDLGASVEEVDPGFESPREVFHVHWFSGAALAFKPYADEQLDLIDPDLRRIIEKGRKIDLETYLEAVARRTVIGMRMNAFHQSYDLLVLPTLPLAAFRVGVVMPDDARRDGWIDWAATTYPFNLTQQPAVSVPCGFTKAGLPVGLQIVGPKYGDALVLKAARAFEVAQPFVMPEEPRAPTAG